MSLVRMLAVLWAVAMLVVACSAEEQEQVIEELREELKDAPTPVALGRTPEGRIAVHFASCPPYGRINTMGLSSGPQDLWEMNVIRDDDGVVEEHWPLDSVELGVVPPGYEESVAYRGEIVENPDTTDLTLGITYDGPVFFTGIRFSPSEVPADGFLIGRRDLEPGTLEDLDALACDKNNEDG